MIKGYSTYLSDVETAFLHGDLHETIYMEKPEGMKNRDSECLLLLKPIYGLVQAAREWWKKLVGSLKECGFEETLIDPCLLLKDTKAGVVTVAIYIDDLLWNGPEKMVKQEIERLMRSGFIMTVTKDLSDYLSCKITFSTDNKRGCVTQPHLIKNLEEKFSDQVKDMKKYDTPGTPGFHGVREKPEEDFSAETLQSEYRTGVGMLLYLVKHSRPEIANAVRELSKVLGKASEADLKEMRRVIKYVLDTRTRGLKLEPKMEGNQWNLEIFSDSDFAGDKEKRLSVSGFILYLCGVPVSWKSKSQKSVALSSTEAEYVALSEAVKEIKFVAGLMKTLKVEVKHPLKVRVDNIGAIYLAENKNVSPRTKHIDTRYHFVKQFVDEEGEIEFVRSEDNHADGFTNNVQKKVIEGQ